MFNDVFYVSTVKAHLVCCHVKCSHLMALLVSSRMHSLLIFLIKRVGNIMHRGMESELGRMVLLRKLNTNSDESLSSLETESPGQHLCLEISTLKQVGMISISKIMGVSLGKKKERKEAEQRAKVFMFYCFILHLEHKYFKSPLLGDIDFFPVVIYSMSFGVKLVATYLLIFFLIAMCHGQISCRTGRRKTKC